MSLRSNYKRTLFVSFFCVNLMVAFMYWGYSYALAQVTSFSISGYRPEYLLGWWYFSFALAFAYVYISTHVRERFLVVLLLASALILFSWPFTKVFLDKRHLFSEGFDDELTRFTAVVDILNLGLLLCTAVWVGTRRLSTKLN